MSLEEAACPVCASWERAPFTVQRGCRWVTCRGCGLVFCSPRPDGATLAKAYEAYLPSTPPRIRAWRRLMEGVFREALDLLVPPPGGGDLLDVGCAFGFFLEGARRRGWRPVGLDLNPRAVARARGRGLDARLQAAESADFPAGSFDAVTLFYVLEHVPSPADLLERVHRWLRPGGRLLLRVPHTAPIVRILGALGIPNELLDPPHHLADFSPRTLRRLLESRGFQGIRTFPGASTNPTGVAALLATKLFSTMAGLLYTGTGGRALLPGVSKTTLARRAA